MIRLEDVLKMSWRRFSRRLKDVLKTSWRRLGKTSWKRLQKVLKMSWRRFCKTFWKRLEDVLARRFEDALKTSWKRQGRRLEDVWPRRIYWSWPRVFEDALETSSEDVRWRRTYSSSSRRLLKTKTKDVFKTSSRRLYQDECLLGELKTYRRYKIFCSYLCKKSRKYYESLKWKIF